MRIGVLIAGIVAIVFLGVVLVSHSVSKPSGVIKPTLVPTQVPSTIPTPVTGQYEFRAEDSGKTAVFPLTSRFQIILSEKIYPKKQLRVSCNPDNLLIPISNIPSVPKPLYAVRFEGVKSGICTIQNNNFSLHVDVVEE